MQNHDLRFKRSVTKDLRAIPKADVARLLARIRALASDPRPVGCEKLSAQDRYRIRLGRFRIVYEIRDRELLVPIIRVAERKDVYRR
jgi:mRNA interferase RelE/StbE